MASLRKKPRSPYWHACFSLPSGRRVQRSTGETKRKAAQEKADEWEALARSGAKARQAHRVVAAIYRDAHNAELPSATPAIYLTELVARRKGEVAQATHVAYEGRAREFIAWLGTAAHRPIAEIDTSTFVRYRDHLAQRVAPGTANLAIKILRILFERARRDGLLPDNPAKDCGTLKKPTESVRRPFTADELRAVLRVAGHEWRSMILFGLYTGQRIGDIARLRWSQIDTVNNEITFVTGKTGRRVRIPLASPLVSLIATLESGEASSAHVHPAAAATKRISTLSRQFREILASCGLAPETDHSKAKAGRDARRTPSELSFHALRYTATSMMKNAGISPAIVQDIIGHESAEISAHYTVVDQSSKRKALEALPDLTP